MAVEVLPEACHKRVGAFLKPTGLATQIVQGIAFANPHTGNLANLQKPDTINKASATLD